MDYDYKNLVVTLRNKLIMTQEEFTSMLLDVIELNQDYILRRLRIIKADINKWDDNQVDNYIEVASRQFPSTKIPSWSRSPSIGSTWLVIKLVIKAILE